MSGGSMDYLCYKVEEANFQVNTTERKAFAKHLKLVAKALHDIELVDSSDYSDGQENEAIRACIGDGAVLDAAIDQAQEAANILLEELERACAGKTFNNK